MVASAQTKTLILDNGGHNLKIGYIENDEPRIIPNSIVKAKHEKKRVFIGQEQDDCTDKFSLFYVRPIERGYVVNWDIQQQIWEKTFQHCNISPTTTRIALTDNNYLIPALPDVSNEILFEYFNFLEVLKGSSSTFVGKHSSSLKKEKCCLVVDCGFSYSTVAPFVNGLLIQDGVIRVDVGGKALTNKLKDWISYRSLNVTEETHIVNELKEDVCFVSQNFEESLKETKKKVDESSLVRRYIMPDFQTTFRGVVQGFNDSFDRSIPSVVLGIERFALPEVLFHPSDIGIDQMGIAEAIIESINRCPENLRAALSENIQVFGGSSCFEGFRERLWKEVRCMLPIDYDLKINGNIEEAQTFAWKCTKEYVQNCACSNWLNRKEWNEHGDSIEFSKFFQTLLSSEEIKATKKKIKITT